MTTYTEGWYLSLVEDKDKMI